MLTVTYGYKNFQTKTIAFYETDLASTQTSVLQEALDSVAAHGGGFVKLSAGTFTVTGKGKATEGALRIGSETVLMGAGMGETVITLATGSAGVAGVVRTDSGGRNADGSLKITSNVRIESLSIDGNKAGTIGNVEGFCFGVQSRFPVQDFDLLLDRVEFMNVSRHGFDPDATCAGLTITNCIFNRGRVGAFAIVNVPHDATFNAADTTDAEVEIGDLTRSNAVLFQDSATTANVQSGTGVQTGDRSAGTFKLDPPIPSTCIAAAGAGWAAISDSSTTILKHRGMDAVGRRVAVGKGLYIDDHLFAHVDAPLDGRRTHVRQGNNAVRV